MMMEGATCTFPSALHIECLHSLAFQGKRRHRLVRSVPSPYGSLIGLKSRWSRLLASSRPGHLAAAPSAVLPPSVPAVQNSYKSQLAPTTEALSSSSQADLEANLLSELWQTAGVGPQPPLLQLHVSSSGVRGLAVCCEAGVPAGELLLSVPLAAVLLVSKETKGGVEDSGGLARAGLHEAVCRLAVKLLLELQQEGSLWQQYARLLPAHYESVADWTNEDMSALQSDAAVAAIIAAKEEWQDQAMQIRLAANSQLGFPSLSSTPAKVSLSSESPHPLPSTFSPPTNTPPEGNLQGVSRIDHFDGTPPPPPLSAAPSPSLWHPPISHEAALWALHTVLSRSFSATLDGRTVQCLVPVADMLNHAFPSLHPRGARQSGQPFQANPSPVWPRSHSQPDLGFAQWRFHRPQGAPPTAACFQVFASGPLSVGQEATISYGPHTSLEFLTAYGFVPETNPADRVPLYDCLQAMIDDVDGPVKLARQKEELLLGLMGGKRNFSADADGAAPQLLESLYILHAHDAPELGSLEAEWHRNASLSSAPVGRPTRAAAARQVVQRCTALLAQHATTLEEDWGLQEELEAGGSEGMEQAGRRMRMALQLRIKRKDILTRTRTRYDALASFS